MIGSISRVTNKLYFSRDSSNATQVYDSDIVSDGWTGVAILSAEIITLRRYVIITGDDFRHQAYDPKLLDAYSTVGYSCNPNLGRSMCTFGLPTMMAGRGTMVMQYIRVEKCGQRGVKGKYCMHLHYMNQCPSCLLRSNAIEFGQQRGIVVHDTHRSTVEDNVLSELVST